MTIQFSSRRRALATGVALFVSAAQALGASAEYAIRWDPAQGGPSTGTAVATLLGLDVDKVKVYQVEYFDIRAEGGAPAVIARRRTRGDTTQLTLKSRSTQGQGASAPSDASCALGGAATGKTEVDVTMLAGEQTQRATSISCTLEGSRDLAFAPELHATAKGCPATMRRFRTDEVEIEEWAVRGGAQRLIEVSRKGADDAATSRRFLDTVVTPLLAAKALPLAGSKTQFVTACRR